MSEHRKSSKRLRLCCMFLILTIHFGSLYADEKSSAAAEAGDSVKSEATAEASSNSEAIAETGPEESPNSEGADSEASADSESSTFVFVPSLPVEVTCPPNEMYRPCLVDCMNCDYRGYCALNCSRSGCDCIANFYRKTPDGPCEAVATCPPYECGENQVFRACGPVCESCSALRCRIFTCEYKCYCKEGYLRDYNWKCVPEDECPKKEQCTDTEVLAESGRVDEYCLHAGNETITNSTQDREGCYCMEGYRRNGLGYCVEEQYCPYVHCIDTEEYMECPKICNTTCRTYGDPNCVEDENCYPGCFCKDGLLMDDYRTCVPLEKCPPGSNPFVPTIAPPIILDVEATPPDTPDAEASTPSSVAITEGEETTEQTPVTTESDEGTTLEEETSPTTVAPTLEPKKAKSKKKKTPLKLSQKAMARAKAQASDSSASAEAEASSP